MLLARSLCKRPVLQLYSLSASSQFKQKQLYSDSSVKDKNLYKILGVNPKATQTEIKDAYYNLTLKFHPDRNEGSPEAAVKFHEITEAYEILGNYFMRKRYDKGMPLPIRHEVPAADVPHVVKYQQFFDARNLPFQPSAYAAGGGARKFDEFHSQQFAERQYRQIIDDDREYHQLCESRKAPTLIAIVILILLVNYVRKDLDMYVGPRNEVQHFENYPMKWNYIEGKPPQI